MQTEENFIRVDYEKTEVEDANESVVFQNPTANVESLDGETEEAKRQHDGQEKSLDEIFSKEYSPPKIVTFPDEEESKGNASSRFGSPIKELSAKKKTRIHIYMPKKSLGQGNTLTLRSDVVKTRQKQKTRTELEGLTTQQSEE